MTDGITLDNALMAKASCWSCEEESRLIYYSKDMSQLVNPNYKDKNGKKNTKESRLLYYIFLEGFSVKAIYFGVRISQKDYFDVIRPLHSNNPSVTIYRMEFKQDDITQLKVVSVQNLDYYEF